MSVATNLSPFKTKPSDIEMINLLHQEAPESQVLHLENTCWGVIVGVNSTQATTSCLGKYFLSWLLTDSLGILL